MATKILGSLLRSLENVYRFQSAQKGSPEEFELDLPIQPVHDLAEMAGFGAAIGPYDGWWQMYENLVHAGAGTLIATQFPRQPTNALNSYPSTPAYVPEDYMPWCYRASAAVSTNNLSYLMVGVEPALPTFGVSDAASPTNFQYPILYAEDTAPLSGTPTICIPDNKSMNQSPCPMPAQTAAGTGGDAFIRFTSKVTAAMTSYFNVLFWLGPTGMRPPR